MTRTLLTVLFILISAVIGTWALAECLESRAFADQLSRTAQPLQQAAQFNPFAGKPKQTRRVKVLTFTPEYREVDVVVSERDQRSQEYSQLMLRKAQRMSEEELNEAITEVKAELAAQDDAAQSQLQQAIEILEELVEQSPGTPAADYARMALPILQGQVPTSESDGPSIGIPLQSLPTY